MRSSSLLSLSVLACSLLIAHAAHSSEPSDGPPLTATERSSTARITRLRSVRLWWDKRNRVTGVSLNGKDANDRAIALAGDLPKLESLVLVACPENALTDRGLEPLAKLPNLKLLSISGDRISDAGLRHLKGHQNLRTLVLNGNFTDEAVKTISSLPNLEYLDHLDLTQARITDAGMGHVAKMTNLRTLVLNGTAITNRGIEKITTLENLTRLYLDRTQINDAAIPYLAQLTDLELLVVRGTQITREAIRTLQPRVYRIIHSDGKVESMGPSPLPYDREMARSVTPPTESTWRAAR